MFTNKHAKNWMHVVSREILFHNIRKTSCLDDRLMNRPVAAFCTVYETLRFKGVHGI